MADRRASAATLRPAAPTAVFTIRLTNDGDGADALLLRGTPTGKQFSVTYRVGGHNGTAAITAGTYRTPSLAPGATVPMVVRLTLTSAARLHDRRVFGLRASSVHAPGNQDTVAAIAVR